MPLLSERLDHRNSATIIGFPGVRIEPFDSGGWLVIAEHGHAWAFGDRPSALREKQWHDRQWGPS
jgi:hypothetical protein